jgi:hypothetical protein
MAAAALFGEPQLGDDLDRIRRLGAVTICAFYDLAQSTCQRHRRAARDGTTVELQEAPTLTLQSKAIASLDYATRSCHWKVERGAVQSDPPRWPWPRGSVRNPQGNLSNVPPARKRAPFMPACQSAPAPAARLPAIARWLRAATRSRSRSPAGLLGPPKSVMVPPIQWRAWSASRFQREAADRIHSRWW